jgi:hypothetical protein
LREALLVAWFELRAGLLGVRALLVVLLYGTVTYAAGGLVKLVVGKLIEQLPPALKLGDPATMARTLTQNTEFQEGVRPALRWLGGDALVSLIERGELPWLVLGILVLSTVMLPGLVLLVGYDRISEDLASRYSRFLFQRIRRGSYLAGKVLGQTLLLFLAVVAVHLVLLLGFASSVPGVSVSEVAASLPRVWTGMLLLLFGYVSFTAMLSAHLKPPFLSLALGAMVLMGAWVLSLAPSLRPLWLGTWDIRLFVLDPSAIVIYLGYSVAFLLAAYAGLAWRDV